MTTTATEERTIPPLPPTETQKITPEAGMVPGVAQSASLVAAQAQAVAEVQASYAMARQYPRSRAAVVQKITVECSSSTFADVAIYRRPVGRKFDRETNQWTDQVVEGLSVRFAEVAHNAYGNLRVSVSVAYEDEDRQLLRAVCEDLENGSRVSFDKTISKTVERRKPRDGDTVLSSRLNSYGDTVYTIRADEIAFAPKHAAERSKLYRDVVLRMVPADIKELAMVKLRMTRANDERHNPRELLNRLSMGFASLNVPAEDLESYLGHPLDQCSPAELQMLRDMYSAISDGAMTWREYVARREESGQGEPGTDDDPKTKAKAPTAPDGEGDNDIEGLNDGTEPKAPAKEPASKGSADASSSTSAKTEEAKTKEPPSDSKPSTKGASDNLSDKQNKADAPPEISQEEEAKRADLAGAITATLEGSPSRQNEIREAIRKKTKTDRLEDLTQLSSVHLTALLRNVERIAKES